MKSQLSIFEQMFELFDLKYDFKNYLSCLNLYRDWYKGHDSEFHSRNIELCNKKKKPINIKTLNMASRIAYDWATLTSEFDFVIEKDKDNNYKELINEILEDNNFDETYNNFLQSVFALGNGLIILTPNNKTEISFLDNFNFVPISWKNGVLKEVVTWLEEEREGQIFLKVFQYGLNSFKISEFIIKDGILKKENLINQEEFLNNIPLFFHYYPNQSNNIFGFDFPLRLSIFANSIDTLKVTDEFYNSLNQEIILGRKRIIVSASAMKSSNKSEIKSNGEIKTEFSSFFDTNDHVFQLVEYEDAEPIKEINMNLRIEEITKGIQANIGYLGEQVGLGSDFYDYSKTKGLSTATEVNAEKSYLVNSMRNHEKVFEKVNKKLLNSILLMNGKESLNIEIKYRDSFALSEHEKRKEDRIDVGLGILSKNFYLIKYKEMNIEEAKEELFRIEEEKLLYTKIGNEEINNESPNSTPRENGKSFFTGIKTIDNL